MRHKIMTIVIIILCLFILVGLGLSVYTWNLYRGVDNGKTKADTFEKLWDDDSDAMQSVLSAAEYNTVV